ncbi:hypothetical protein BS47DRAFT_1392844 [Hydnum rufescens UP504]|uniref:Uncharacterized protein n=1 Tax=Hydnum rufescens UP504 TaxID=1448309 RepID=A0A9P6AXR2_9AGAM|nr:hypothetical protein BS47DRAFT_1392844 [Hydnum rufescens UP504]
MAPSRAGHQSTSGLPDLEKSASAAFMQSFNPPLHHGLFNLGTNEEAGSKLIATSLFLWECQENIRCFYKNPAYDLDLVLKHLENGNNVQKNPYRIMVMAVKEGDVQLIHPQGELLRTNLNDNRHIIQKRQPIVSDTDVMVDEEAEWPAVIFRSKFENEKQVLFHTFMDSFNLIQTILPNALIEIWRTGSAPTAMESPYRYMYIKRLVSAPTNYCALLRALSQPKLRKAIDILIKILLYEPSVANAVYWTSNGGSTIWAAILEEAFNSFERLTEGQETWRSVITSLVMLSRKDQQIQDRKGFMKLASQFAERDPSLWSEFAPHLPSLEDRWERLMGRDASYESLLHEAGNEAAVLPWVPEFYPF